MTEEEKEELQRKRNTFVTGRANMKGIIDHQQEYLQAYLDREVEMDTVFKRTVKVADELLSRVEREMHRGMQYKADQDPTQSNFDPKVSKSAEGLAKVVAQLQSIHLRLLKEGERQAKNMSREEKIQYCVKFISSLPKLERNIFKRDMGWDE
jgi:hypothetical protein